MTSTQSTIARAALQVAGFTGQPLLSAGDHSEVALAAAAVNNMIRLPGWCSCNPEGEQAYWRNERTGSHGWLCCNCFKTTQVG